tara:strand:- start:1624 stop:1854 length:231 start_codon:yes stop_codon:yes gene_type:complete
MKNKKHKQNMYEMLLSHVQAKKTKALLTLDLLCDNPAGIGDHSTDDFYNNAIDAIEKLTDAHDQLMTIKSYFDVDS